MLSIDGLWKTALAHVMCSLRYCAHLSNLTCLRSVIPLWKVGTVSATGWRNRSPVLFLFLSRNWFSPVSYLRSWRKDFNVVFKPKKKKKSVSFGCIRLIITSECEVMVFWVLDLRCNLWWWHALLEGSNRLWRVSFRYLPVQKVRRCVCEQCSCF